MVCPICLDVVGESEEAPMSCGCVARYHSPCLQEWLSTNGTCPTCRGVAAPCRVVYWSGERGKRKECVGDVERLWWSNGKTKAELRLRGDRVVSGWYKSSLHTRKYDVVVEFSVSQIAELRTSWAYIHL